jgi:hypothetical protein
MSQRFQAVVVYIYLLYMCYLSIIKIIENMLSNLTESGCAHNISLKISESLFLLSWHILHHITTSTTVAYVLGRFSSVPGPLEMKSKKIV